jgi:hypothetical protein
MCVFHLHTEIHAQKNAFAFPKEHEGRKQSKNDAVLGRIYGHRPPAVFGAPK